MQNKALIALAVLAIAPVPATAQEIVINASTPCFENLSAGIDMWRQCGLGDDYLQTALLPWEYITGGYFSMILVSIIIMVTYIKYHKIAYPMLIGVMFLPMSYFLFPESFVIWGVLLAFAGLGILIWYIFMRQTKEF